MLFLSIKLRNGSFTQVQLNDSNEKNKRIIQMKWGQDEPPFLSVCKGWEREQKPAFRCGIGSHSQSFRRQSSQHSSLQLPFLFWSILCSLCSPLLHSPQSPFPHITLLFGSPSRSQVHFSHPSSSIQ